MANPRVLKQWNVFVNNRGKAGIATKFTPPEIKVKTEDYRGGGMDTETELDMGLEKLTSKFSLADPDPDTLVLVGLSDGNSARVVVRGSFVRDSDGERVAEVHEMVGRLKGLTTDEWEAGKKVDRDFEMSLNYYRHTVGGRDIFEIDVENMIRKINGVDQLAGIRADIAM